MALYFTQLESRYITIGDEHRINKPTSKERQHCSEQTHPTKYAKR